MSGIEGRRKKKEEGRRRKKEEGRRRKKKEEGRLLDASPKDENEREAPDFRHGEERRPDSRSSRKMIARLDSQSDNQCSDSE